MTKFDWNTIPGYKVFLNLYIDKIKEIKLSNYPKIFPKTGISLMENTHNLSLFVFTLISKTK